MASTPAINEEDETAPDESQESPEVEAQEQADGTEQHNSVPISEEFQLMIMDIVKNMTPEECMFLKQQIDSKEAELSSKSEPTMDDYAAAKE